jgi:hypothetical protein
VVGHYSLGDEHCPTRASNPPAEQYILTEAKSPQSGARPETEAVPGIEVEALSTVVGRASVEDIARLVKAVLGRCLDAALEGAGGSQGAGHSLGQIGACL